MVGTVSYIAPEQIKGRPRFASDQYALAAVVYEWLCGVQLFSGAFTEVALQHLLIDPEPLCDKVPTIPPAVEQVIMKALAKNAFERFPQVQDFACALEQSCVSQLSYFVPFSPGSQPAFPPLQNESPVVELTPGYRGTFLPQQKSLPSEEPAPGSGSAGRQELIYAASDSPPQPRREGKERACFTTDGARGPGWTWSWGGCSRSLAVPPAKRANNTAKIDESAVP